MRAQRILTTVLLLGLLWYPLQGWADDDKGAYIVYGFGVTKCSEWNAAFKDVQDPFSSGMHLLYINWLYGYLSGVNAVLPDTYDINTGAYTFDKNGRGYAMGAITLIGTFCQIDPYQSIAAAAGKMVKALYPTRVCCSLGNFTPFPRQNPLPFLLR
jgi:hypothetical protein